VLGLSTVATFSDIGLGAFSLSGIAAVGVKLPPEAFAVWRTPKARNKASSTMAARVKAAGTTDFLSMARSLSCGFHVGRITAGPVNGKAIEEV
jgi:hypothetical protein